MAAKVSVSSLAFEYLVLGYKRDPERGIESLFKKKGAGKLCFVTATKKVIQSVNTVLNNCP